MAKNDLTAERLRELFHYDPDTGVFMKRVNSRRRPNCLVPAGGLSNTGYIAIRADQFVYQAHRLAWLYIYGVWPKHFIDHKNRIRHDNRLCNLREACAVMNAQNSTPIKKRSGLPNGVFFRNDDKILKKFCARVDVNKRRYFLGYFLTADEAHAAYLRARQDLHIGFLPGQANV